MSEATEFKTWAIVEVMGHVEYAGFVTAETIAGSAMLRVDVPDVDGRGAFTKYLSTGALYGISPCSEATARARAGSIKATPFSVWDVQQQVMDELKKQGRLIENKSTQPVDDDEDKPPF
jgi:hypothetical protein